LFSASDTVDLSEGLLDGHSRFSSSEVFFVRGSLPLVKVRAGLELTLVALRGEPWSIHGDLSPEAAIAVIKERLSGRWFPGGSKGDGFVFGYASANSIALWARLRSVGTSRKQIFKGRLIGDGTGCVLVGSMRIPAFTRALVYLTLGLACLVVAAVWGFVVWHAIGGGLTLSMIRGALATTGFPLVFFCLYVWPDAHSAAEAAYLKEWLVDCINADAPDGRAPHM
jgi:hypothetical protein